MKMPIVISAAAILLLAGCASAPDSPSAGSTAPIDPSEATIPSAAPSPIASATPEAVTIPPSATPTTGVHTVELAVTGVTVVPGDGSPLELYEFYQPATDLVTALTEAFGSAPAESRFEGSLETLPGTSYSWDGFVVSDPDGAGVFPGTPEYFVSLETDAVADVSIVIPTESDYSLSIGTVTATDVFAAGGSVASESNPDGDAADGDGDVYRLGTTTVGEGPDQLDFSLLLFQSGEEITRVFAPSQEGGV